MQGVGKYHKELRIKTESKIVAFLSLQQFPFNELQLISGIGRNGLRDSLDSLIVRKIVSIIKNPTDKKVRRGTYYSLNPNNKEAKHLLDAYYKELPPLYTATVKKEVLSSLDKFHRNIESENDDIMKQVTTFKKEIAPYIDKPNNAINVWVDCIELFRHDRQLITKKLKIFAIKLRLKLDYV